MLGIKADGGMLVVECEKSHGNIVDDGGKLDKWSRDDELRSTCEFHFILHEKAWHRRNQVRKFFGENVLIYRYRDAAEELEPVRL